MGYFNQIASEPAAQAAMFSWQTAGQGVLGHTGKGQSGVQAIAKAIGFTGDPYTPAYHQAIMNTGAEGFDAANIPVEYSPEFLKATEGFRFESTAMGEDPAITVYDPSGRSLGTFQTGNGSTGFDDFAFKAIPLGVAALGGAALGGFIPGAELGAAGSTGGFTAGAVDSAALGLDGVAAGSGTVGGGLVPGASAGYGSIATGAGVTPSVLGAGGAGMTGAGLTAPTLGAGAGLTEGLGLTAAGTAGVGAGGGITSLLSKLGDFATSGAGIQSLFSLASGAYGMKLAGDVRESADPFAQYRPAYGQALATLEADPSSITTRPGFMAGIDAIKRTSAAGGYYGSGNMASALSRYSGDFYTQEAQRLAQLAGAGQTPGAGQVSSADLASKSLGSIGYGLAPLIQSLLQGY